MDYTGHWETRPLKRKTWSEPEGLLIVGAHFELGIGMGEVDFNAVFVYLKKT